MNNQRIITKRSISASAQKGETDMEVNKYSAGVLGECNEIKKRFLLWDGSNIETFANTFTIEELGDMDHWAYEYGCYQPSAYEEFPELYFTKGTFFPIEAKVFIVKSYVRCSLMMAVYACEAIEGIEQKDLVAHFYNLMTAIDGVATNERS